MYKILSKGVHVIHELLIISVYDVRNKEVVMFKKYLMAGLLFWVPLVVTIVTIEILLDIIISIFGKLPAKMQPDFWLGFHVPGIEIVLIILMVWVSGLLMANLFGRKLVYWGESVVEKVPLVRSIYSGVKQIMQMMVKSDSTAFRQVVLVSFPQKGSWAVGLVTQVVEHGESEYDAITVFLPTTPNPTSGYVVIVQRKDAIILDMSVDEALKYIISLGTLSHDTLNQEFGRLAQENKK